MNALSPPLQPALPISGP